MSEDALWTAEELAVRHGMFFHLWVLADRCAEANRDDLARTTAAWLVRDFCSQRMAETVTEARRVPSPEGERTSE